MSRFRITTLMALMFLMAALPSMAQQNELGVFVSMARFDTTTVTDPELEGDATIEFSEKLGYGVSYNRYWGQHLSTEFAAQQINSDGEFSFDLEGTEISFDLGEVELMTYSAVLQWH